MFVLFISLKFNQNQRKIAFKIEIFNFIHCKLIQRSIKMCGGGVVDDDDVCRKCCFEIHLKRKSGINKQNEIINRKCNRFWKMHIKYCW